MSRCKGVRVAALFLILALPLFAHDPQAIFTATPSSGPPPFTVAVDASGSLAAHGTITAWDWNWGDGTAGSSGLTATHTYASIGTYVITLTITETGGLTGSSTQYVHCLTAGNAVPAAFIDSPASPLGTAPYTVAFVGRGQDAAPAGDLLEHRWQLGDGSPDVVFTGLLSGQTSTPSHSYAAAGAFQATLIVKDGEGVYSSASIPVAVFPPSAPIPLFSATPASGPPTLTVTTDASASVDPGGSISAYAWDWGDGTAGSSGVTASHSYPSTGTYTITLTVTNAVSVTASATKNVHCISATNTPPSSHLQAGIPQSGPWPLLVRFLGHAHDDTGPLTHHWDFGDGSAPVDFPAVANHANTSPPHLFTQKGDYTVTLTVRDPENIRGSSSLVVRVVDSSSSGGGGGGVCGATGMEAILLLLLRRRKNKE